MPEMHDRIEIVGTASDPRMMDMAPEAILRARLAVCRNATDAIDAKDLLEMLGLYA